jgi:hypothetical protein
MYVNSKKLKEEILFSHLIKRLTPEAKLMLNQMVLSISNTLKYQKSGMKAYCISYSRKSLFRNWSSYNPDKVYNTYAYYSEVIKRGLSAGYTLGYNRYKIRNEKIEMVLLKCK